jgi:N-acetyl-anhydromuramyl-L-alanine amidase AmpD
VREINRIVIHHSASKLKTTAADIDGWHRERGWSGIGYHLVIHCDGKLVAGRPLEEVGAHVAGHNEGSIGICVVGDNTTMANRWNQVQTTTLRSTLMVLATLFGDPEVLGHRDIQGTATECPGLDVRALLGLAPNQTKSHSTDRG